MLAEDRCKKILDILDSMGSVTVQQLMDELDTSESTIRRDLVAMDKKGYLTKVHGGAIANNTNIHTQDEKVINRLKQNRSEKEQIARYAASLGGEFKSTTEAIVGDEAVVTLDKYNFTKGFWGTNGITVKNGFTTPEIKEAMVKKKSMENSKEKYILADDSKFSQVSSIKFADFEDAVINTDFIEVEDGISRINVKLRSNEESEINGQGPVITEDNIKKLYEKLDCLKESDVLVLAGSIPDVMPSSMYMDIMKHLEGRGINIVVDATRNLLTNVLAYKPFLIKPNNHELGEIFGVEVTDKDDVIKYAKKLQEQGARNVLVSMAGDGAVLVTEDGQEFKAQAPKGKLKNSVGAGDSMVAGFVYGYLKSNDYKQAFIYGVCTGSASAFSEELATKPEVEALIDKWDSASN